MREMAYFFFVIVINFSLVFSTNVPEMVNTLYAGFFSLVT